MVGVGYVEGAPNIEPNEVPYDNSRNNYTFNETYYMGIPFKKLLLA